MARRVDLFCEDAGHELFVTQLLTKIAIEVGVPITIQTENATGGHGRAVSEFRLYQAAFRKGVRAGTPDLLVVVIDGNCKGYRAMKAEIQGAIDDSVFPRACVGCPDPHVEKWCFADPTAFHSVLGVNVPRDPGKCARDVYKQLLNDSVSAAGPVLTTSMEVAPDIVDAMNLGRAGGNDASLGSFVSELRAALKAP